MYGCSYSADEEDALTCCEGYRSLLLRCYFERLRSNNSVVVREKR